MKQIDVAKLQSDMDEHGYNRTRLAGVLRCSGQTVSNVLNRGTIDDADVEVLETIFNRPKGYYNVVGQQPQVQAVGSDELLKLVQEFNTNVFSHDMAIVKELRLMNETMLTTQAAIKELQKTIAKFEGIHNNNTQKIQTTIAKVRADTDALKTTVGNIERELKS